MRNIAKKFKMTMSLIDIETIKPRYKCFFGEDVELCIKVIDEDARPVDLTDVNAKVYYTCDKFEPLRQDNNITINEPYRNGTINILVNKKYLRLGVNTIRVALFDSDQEVLLQPCQVNCIETGIGDEHGDVIVNDDINVKDEFIKTNNKVNGIDGRLKVVEGDVPEIKRGLADVNEQLEHKTNKTETQSIQQQLNNLVLGAVGDGNNPEVIQARGKEDVINDRLTKIENGNVNNLSFLKFNKTDVDIIDYKTTLYNKKITGYDTSTFLPIYGDNIGSIVITLRLTLYSGTIKIPKYNANGQAMLLCASGKVFKNFTYSNLANDTLAWLTATDNYFEINLSKLYKYCWTTFYNKVVTELIIAMDKNNSFVYRKNGIVLSDNESLVDQVTNSFPFIPSANLIKNGRNYRCLMKAIKDIKIYTNDLTHKFYIRFLTVGTTIGLHIATTEKGDTVLNIPSIEIKSGIQKVDFTVQNSSGYSGYVLIDTSLIDVDLSTWGWFELDYETSGLSSCVLNKPVETTIVDTEEYKIIIPPKIYGVSDKEVALYLDNITSLKLDNYIIRKVSGTGDLKSRNRIIYNINTTGWSDKTKLELYKDNGDKIKDLEIPFKIVGDSTNADVTKKCLFIGDSFIANGSITSELVNLFKNDVMNIELLGTKGSGTNKHEGRSGWSSYDYAATSSFNNSTNAFLNNGSFDFNYYITQNSIDTPDWVFLQVGINDTWRPMNGTTTVQNLQTIINSIKSFDNNIKVGIGLICPPYLGEYGLNNSYDHLKRININETIINTFKDKESENVFIVPINVNLDCIYNFNMTTTTINSRNTETIKKCSDDTHPANSGYYQISDSYYCFLKCN